MLSNPRFQLNALHAEVMASLEKSGYSGQGHVILSTSDFVPWTATVDAVHKCSGWVVCIDPSIDEQLLRKGSEASYDRSYCIWDRSCSHGEKNYTISTEQFWMSDIENRVAAELSKELGIAEPDAAETIAAALVGRGG